jgi:DNA-binding transcriptional regulator YiaG
MSQNLSQILRHEITRLARREIRVKTASTRKATAHFRRDIAGLKRLVSSIDKRLATIEAIERKRLEAESPPVRLAEGARFSPGWLRAHRKRLGISAADYAKLVGVTGVTIYNWEQGKQKPRKEQLAALVAARGLGKREVQRRLAMLAAS